MANSPQAKKRIRQNLRARALNKSVKSRLRTEVKRFNVLLADGNKDEAQKQYAVVSKALDQTASKNIIHKKNASRSKSRFAVRLNSL